MYSIFRLLPVFALALSLSSCDSLKSKVLAVLDKKIEETGGDGSKTDGGAPIEGIRELTGDNYGLFTTMQGQVVVAEFHASWCSPCLRLKPVLESMVQEHQGQMALGLIDIDKNKEFSIKEGATQLPDVRIFVNGQQVERMVNPDHDKLRQAVAAQVSKLPAAPAEPEPEPQPKPEPKPEPQPKPEPPSKPEPKPDPTKPEEPKEDPKIKKMDKDWLPPGIQRKGT